MAFLFCKTVIELLAESRAGHAFAEGIRRSAAKSGLSSGGFHGGIERSERFRVFRFPAFEYDEQSVRVDEPPEQRAV